MASKAEIGQCVLTKVLRSRKMRQIDLATKTGIAEDALSKYVHRQKLMSLTTAFTIAHALNCQIEDLYEVVFQDR